MSQILRVFVNAVGRERMQGDCYQLTYSVKFYCIAQGRFFTIYSHFLSPRNKWMIPVSCDHVYKKLSLFTTNAKYSVSFVNSFC